MEEAIVCLLLSAAVIHHATASPRERPLLGPAANVANASEILSPPMNQAG